MKDNKYADFCETEAKNLYEYLYKLKFEDYNHELVDYYLKENKIKRKVYEETLSDLYKKCDFLLMRYSKDKDVIEAYVEVDGDREAAWFFSLAYKAYKEKVLFGVCHLIEKKYNIPVHSIQWYRMGYA